MIDIFWIVLIVFLALVVVICAVFSLRKNKKNDGIRGSWEFNEDATSLPQIPRYVWGLIIITLFFVFVLVFAPAFGRYISDYRINPFLSLVMIHIPLFLLSVMLISVIRNTGILEKKNIVFALIIVLSEFLVNLWLPTQIITKGCLIYVCDGYRATPAYIMFYFWNNLLGVDVMQYQLFSYSLAWILIYIVGTIVIVLLIIMIILIERFMSKRK